MTDDELLPEDLVYFEGPCTCDHAREQHDWGGCDVDGYECEHGCHYHEVYGFVPMCGCPIHDPDDLRGEFVFNPNKWRTMSFEELETECGTWPDTIE